MNYLQGERREAEESARRWEESDCASPYDFEPRDEVIESEEE